jgi:alkylated DNA repair dioxygenase AlkB
MNKQNFSIVKGATVLYISKYISNDKADYLFDMLYDKNKFNFQNMYYYDNKSNKIYNKPNHRQSYWLGEYAQSTQSTNFHTIIDTQKKIQMPTDYTSPYKFPLIVLKLKEDIEKEYNCTFNSCLVGLYNNTDQQIRFHNDSSDNLGPDPQIASISLGPTDRLFKLKGMKGSGYEYDKTEVMLSHGDLVIMKDGTNAKYLHAVARDNKCNENNVRINLTFRNYTYTDDEKVYKAQPF